MGKNEKILALFLLTDLSITLHKAKPNTLTVIIMIAMLITSIVTVVKELFVKEETGGKV